MERMTSGLIRCLGKEHSVVMVEIRKAESIKKRCGTEYKATLERLHHLRGGGWRVLNNRTGAKSEYEGIMT